MPVLANTNHERFLHNVVEGLDLGPAYTAAGYKATGNAAEVGGGILFKKPHIQERYRELMAPAVKRIIDARDIARQCTAEAVGTLKEVMLEKDAPHSARVAAASILLDRGHGKAVQHIEAEISIYDKLSLDEKQALLDALDAIDGDEEDDPG